MYEKLKENLNVSAGNAISDIQKAAYTVFTHPPADVHTLQKPNRDFFMDTRGFTYHSVRFCDLDLIKDK